MNWKRIATLAFVIVVAFSAGVQASLMKKFKKHVVKPTEHAAQAVGNQVKAAAIDAKDLVTLPKQAHQLAVQTKQTEENANQTMNDLRARADAVLEKSEPEVEATLTGASTDLKDAQLTSAQAREAIDSAQQAAERTAATANTALADATQTSADTRAAINNMNRNLTVLLFLLIALCSIVIVKAIFKHGPGNVRHA